MLSLSNDVEWQKILPKNVLVWGVREATYYAEDKVKSILGKIYVNNETGSVLEVSVYLQA